MTSPAVHRTDCSPQRGLGRLAFLAVLLAAGVANADEPGMFLIAGTYSPTEGEGIVSARWDPRTGKVGAWQSTPGTRSTVALVAAPSGRFLYATTVPTDPKATPRGAVTAYTIDPANGVLRVLGTKSSGGDAPCHLSIDSEGSCLFVAHCGSADVAALPIDPDGRLGDAVKVIKHTGESRNSEGKPQAHSITVAPGNRFAIACDLGLDRLFVYRIDPARGGLTPNDPPFTSVTTGAGPRHLAFAPSGDFAYSINELNNTVTACALDRTIGALRVVDEITTLPRDFAGESYAADIQVHPAGRFLYGTNRGHDSIAAFRIDPRTGRLESLGRVASGGKFPRSAAFDPEGRFLVVANQKSDSLAVFRVDAESGRLELAGPPVALSQPVCVKVVRVK